ncbi:LacI family DNA-binding transcriptional regulator [Hamadaea tsunoensis]|uniref:LacI family DNA-binding transcriptional regulator n=1 Tax=Hamadaea tsunoensis TaxID=53368 RepID=UPI002ADE3E3D|nr:LacI family DNA-binding transcriptional regulator [Hamadaea tsunoensis]
MSLKDIAKHAGVSLATVSNVVNGYRPVGEATRERVQQAIDELGYTPNLSARHLRRGRTGVIALAIPELNNPYFAELAGFAIREARNLGYTLLIDYTDGDRDTELTLAEGFREQIIDGIILSPVQITRGDILGRSSDLPLVLIGESVFDVPHDHIAIDNLAASHAAVQHLVSLDRRRIAFVGAHEDVNRQPAHLRLSGYREALATAGLPVDPSLVATATQFGRADGLTAMRTLLALPEPPDAVFAYNDLIAIGAMRAITEAGLRIPEDVAVIGFDDVEEGRFSNPTLTTIAPDKEHIGRLAVRSLVDRVEGKAVDAPRDVASPFRLVTRESTLGRRR